MVRKMLFFGTVMFLAMTAISFAGERGQKKEFTGTWTCLACDLKKLDGVRAQCEDFGHKHCLRLNDGRYIQFLENDHSTDLIKGGGRHEVQLTVRGIYDSKSHTIDVESYVIDGITTTWCTDHSRMDHCAWQAEHQEKKKDSGSEEKG
jgi:hypothetical protein